METINKYGKQFASRAELRRYEAEYPGIAAAPVSGMALMAECAPTISEVIDRLNADNAALRSRVAELEAALVEMVKTADRLPFPNGYAQVILDNARNAINKGRQQ